MKLSLKVGDVITAVGPEGIRYEVTDISQVGVALKNQGTGFQYNGWYEPDTSTYKLCPDTPLDLTKPIQFRNGNPCRLVGTRENGQLVIEAYGISCYRPDGRFQDGHESGFDVINAPPPPVWPQKRYVKVWKNQHDAVKFSTFCNTKEQAKAKGTPGAGYVAQYVQEVVFNGPQS